METGYTFHVKKIHIERSNDTWISSLRNNSSFAILFITQASDIIYNRDPQPLKLFQPSNSFLPISGVYLYYSSTDTILWNKPTYCFQSQLCINNIKSGTIAAFYKHYGAIAHSSRVTDWCAWSLWVWCLLLYPKCVFPTCFKCHFFYGHKLVG